jgi:hypothetical protein
MLLHLPHAFLLTTPPPDLVLAARRGIPSDQDESLCLGHEEQVGEEGRI